MLETVRDSNAETARDSNAETTKNNYDETAGLTQDVEKKLRNP